LAMNGFIWESFKTFLMGPYNLIWLVRVEPRHSNSSWTAGMRNPSLKQKCCWCLEEGIGQPDLVQKNKNITWDTPGINNYLFI
jgi:hypothetical protein